ncbi:DUF305 domain-containing protein (plasmid) [Deinococcus metallilatus]|nr:DUF305 domain-containing protein [Deinococcus metallilatus]RXJ14906.1 DUF305 domain-containing protein [Deinococcus metallilatus]TLK31027.1 DUF305 domain-containing protein [Deinococcus metallilatus]
MNHGTMHMATPATGMNPPMDLSALKAMTGKAFDRAFLSMMIPHHQAAVAMSQAVLGTRDPKVKAWANTIIRDQNREIAQMNTLLKSYGGADSEMQASMMGDMASSVKSASNKDRAFVQGMIPHHASAIDMANLALQKSQNLSVLGLARDITRAQAAEMYDFKAYLLR